MIHRDIHVNMQETRHVPVYRDSRGDTDLSDCQEGDERPSPADACRQPHVTSGHESRAGDEGRGGGDDQRP